MKENSIDLREQAGTVAVDDTDGLRARVVTLEEENAHLRLQLAVMSSTDSITGLANRTGIVDSIEMALHRLVRMGEPFAVVGVRFAELAGLDLTRDRLDAVRDLGALLAACLRDVDQVGRLDETTFMVILANVPTDHVATVTDRTTATIRAMTAAATVDVDLRALFASVSIARSESAIEVETIFNSIDDLLERGDESVLVL